MNSKYYQQKGNNEYEKAQTLQEAKKKNSDMRLKTLRSKGCISR